MTPLLASWHNLREHLAAPQGAVILAANCSLVLLAACPARVSLFRSFPLRTPSVCPLIEPAAECSVEGGGGRNTFVPSHL